MIIFDANMILRYLLDDNQVMSEKAEEYLNTNRVRVTIEVIAEVVYVLKGVYKLERKEISQILKDFLNLVFCQEKEVLNQALDTYSNHNLDFIDSVLYAYNRVNNIEIATFDKQLLKLISSNK
jgi:predicted nucleic-acid-binding protein